MGRRRRHLTDNMPETWREPAVVFPSSDDIAARAHELFVVEGRRITCIPEYWRAAEAELLDRAVRRVLYANRGPRPL